MQGIIYEDAYCEVYPFLLFGFVPRLSKVYRGKVYRGSPRTTIN